MATLADLRSAISDDIDDTTGEYSAQITSAIQAAIRYCERKNFYFTQSRTITFSTVAAQQFYGAADNSLIPSLVQITDMWSEDSSGRRFIISQEEENELEYLSDNSASSGRPYAYAYFAQQIRLYPVPDSAAYTIRVQVGAYKLTQLSADSDTNVWLTEGYDMIKARAKYILAKDTVKDATIAAEALNDFNDQMRVLSDETSRRGATGEIEATCF